MKNLIAYWFLLVFCPLFHTALPQAFSDSTKVTYPKDYGAFEIVGKVEGYVFHLFSPDDKKEQYDYFEENKTVLAPKGTYRLTARDSSLIAYKKIKSTNAIDRALELLDELFGPTRNALLLGEFTVKEGENTKIVLADYFGTLKVEADKAEMGSSRLFHCNTNKDYGLEHLSCLEFSSITIGKAVPLPVGNYQLSYSRTLAQNIEIKVASETKVNLGKITLPSERAGLKFRAFIDYSVESERKKTLLFSWSFGEKARSDYEKEFCKRYVRQCPEVTQSPWTQEGLISVFRKNGDLLFLSLIADRAQTAKWENRGRIWLNETAIDTDKSLLVLPGTYGIEYSDVAGKVVDTEYGIEVH